MAGKRGQPTKLTPETQKKLCDAIASGNYYEAACAYARISYDVFRLWMKKGEAETSGSYFDFFNAVTLAQAQAEIRVVAQWQQQIPENWQAARDFLERRFPDRWSRKDKHEITGKDGQPIRSESRQVLDWDALVQPQKRPDPVAEKLKAVEQLTKKEQG